MNQGAGFQEPPADVNGRGLPNVVGVGFESQSQNADLLALQTSQLALDPAEDPLFLPSIDFDHGFRQPLRRFQLPAGPGQRHQILGKAGAPEAGTRMQKLGADPLVEPHGPGHVMDVGSDFLAQVGHLVDKGDLGRQKGIAGILDEFGRLQAGDHKRRLIQVEGAIDVLDDSCRPFTIRPDHHPIGAHEVFHRGALPQKLGIGNHVELDRPALLPPQQALNPSRRAHRYRALGDDDLVVVQALGQGGRHRIDLAQVGRAVRQVRGSHRDKYRQGSTHSRLQVG